MNTLTSAADAANPKDAKSTRADWIAQRMADEIVGGGLAPGQRLDESELALRFQVSRTPVREALRMLDAMGLVEKRPHRGVVVANVSVARMEEMFVVMAEIEAVCARHAARNMTAAERIELEAVHRSSASLVRDGLIEAYERHNSGFHSAIYRGTHNRFLEETARWIRRRVAPFRKAQFKVPARLALSYEEHERVVQAILRGDAGMAAAAMWAHLTTVSDAAERFVSAPPERS